MEPSLLEALDVRGYSAVAAVAHDRGPPGGSLANPHAFVCDDGKTYWVKSAAQYGLVAELVGGRLAATARVGPLARIVSVDAAALPADGSANHLQGVLVGIEDRPGTVNNKDIAAILNGGALDESRIDAKTRGGVIVFQTWVGAEDSQLLVNLTTGQITTIDHGGCFGAVSTPVPPSIIVTPIAGISDDVGRQADCVDTVLDSIEAITDDDLLKAVARVPDEPAWQADRARRLQIAEWLSFRRGQLRAAVGKWLS